MKLFYLQGNYSMFLKTYVPITGWQTNEAFTVLKKTESKIKKRISLLIDS